MSPQPRRAHIVLAHPEPKSFNASLAKISRKALVKQGWACSFTDLYAQGFDPREGAAHFPDRRNPDRFVVQDEQRHASDGDKLPAEVEAEIKNILAAELLVIHFPIWWFGMPAMLKGWIDRVLVSGKIYRSKMIFDAGVAKDKRMLACITTGADARKNAPNGLEGDIDLVVWPLLYPFRYVGYQILRPHFCLGVKTRSDKAAADDDQIESFLQDWRDALSAIDARDLLAYNKDDDFDENGQLIKGAPSFTPFIRQS